MISTSGGEFPYTEPSRILSGEPYPPVVVLCGLANRDSIDPDTVSELVDNLLSQDPIRKILISSDSRGVQARDSVTRIDESRLNPLSDSFKEFDEVLFHQDSVLFVPAGLQIETTAWEDLTMNDVSVNWLAVDPVGQHPERGRVMIQSDWVRKIGKEISRVRSAGTVPGVFHLTADAIELFEKIAFTSQNLIESIDELIRKDGIKLRPGYLQDREWEIQV